MDTIVCAGKIAGAVVLHGIVLTIVLSKLNDCVIYTGGESREALQEVSLLISRFQGSDCVGLLTIGGLLAADVVDFIGSLVSKNIKLGAHAITFKNGATCSLVLGNLVPHSRVSLLSEAGCGRWVVALISGTCNGSDDGSDDSFSVHGDE